MKPTKSEMRKAVANYGTACANAETFKSKGDREAYSDAILSAQALFDKIYDDLNTLCADEGDGVELDWKPICWVGVNNVGEIFVTDGKRVEAFTRGQWMPIWGTSYAICPPRKMPPPPKGGEKDAGN